MRATKSVTCYRAESRQYIPQSFKVGQAVFLRDFQPTAMQKWRPDIILAQQGPLTSSLWKISQMSSTSSYRTVNATTSSNE